MSGVPDAVGVEELRDLYYPCLQGVSTISRRGSMDGSSTVLEVVSEGIGHCGPVATEGFVSKVLCKTDDRGVFGQQGSTARPLRCPGWPKKWANANLQKSNKNAPSAYPQANLGEG